MYIVELVNVEILEVTYNKKYLYMVSVVFFLFDRYFNILIFYLLLINLKN